MYTLEQKKKAVELLMQYESPAAVIRELGYPNRLTLRSWKKDYLEFCEVTEHSLSYESKDRAKALERKEIAVKHYIEHGRNAAKTIRALGYPRSQATLTKWVDELAPGQRRKYVVSGEQRLINSKASTKVKAVLELSEEDKTVAELAKRYGIAEVTLYHWRSHLQRDAIISRAKKGKVDSVTPEEKLKKVEDELAVKEALLKSTNELLQKKIKEVEELEFELNVRQATMEILKKDLGGDPNRLNNEEKTLVINALREKWGLRKLLERFDMAKSSYEYQVKVLGTEAHKIFEELKQRVRDAFQENKGIYGYRCLLAELNADVEEAKKLSEWQIRKCMRELKLCARQAKKKKRYSSYKEEAL